MMDSSDLPESVGSRLRQAREARGLSINTISERLKFSPRQIEFLEGGRYEQLPGRAFTRGFVRSYARFLNLPDDELLTQVEREMPPENAPPERPVLRGAVLPTHKRRWRVPMGIFIALLILGLGGAGVWWLFDWLQSSHLIQTPARDNQLLMEDVPPFEGLAASQAASGAAASAASASALPASRVAASAAKGVKAAGRTASQPQTVPAGAALELKFKGASWVDVRDGQGKSLFKGLGQKNQSVALKGKPPFRIKIGKATAVDLRLSGQAVDLKPYTRGEVASLTLPSAR